MQQINKKKWKTRNDRMGKAVHWEFRKKFEFELTNKW